MKLLFWQELSEYVFFYGYDIAKYFIYGKYPRLLKGYANPIFKDNIEKFLDKNIYYVKKEKGKNIYKLKINDKYYVTMVIAYYSKNINNYLESDVLIDYDLFGYYKKRKQYLFLPLNSDEYWDIEPVDVLNNIKNNIINKTYVIITHIENKKQIDRLLSLRKIGFRNKQSGMGFVQNCDDCCPICLDSINDGIKLNCNHVFHYKCFIQLFLQHNLDIIVKCPMCRTDYDKFNLF